MPKTTRSWGATLKRALVEFGDDNGTTMAAGLTYYSVLALFPALLALVSVLGLLPDSAQVMAFIDGVLGRVLPADSAAPISDFLAELTRSQAAGWGLAAGLVGAVWSASGYVGAFSTVMNEVYSVGEGRPFWKRRPMNLLVTLTSILLVALALTIMVVGGPVLAEIGQRVGLGASTLQAWNIARWPLLAVVVVLIVALLYYATPNVQQPRFRWLSVGAAVAIGVWMLASVGFGLYVSHVGSYNKTYGALAGVVVLLLWLWITNVALVFGAVLDAEIERTRQLHAGIAAEEKVQLPLRDDRGLVKKRRRDEEMIAEAKLVRIRRARESKD